MIETIKPMEIEINSQIILLTPIISRKAPGRNNHNAGKLIEKNTNLARGSFKWRQDIVENYFSMQIILPGFWVIKKTKRKILKIIN